MRKALSILDSSKDHAMPIIGSFEVSGEDSERARMRRRGNDKYDE
jgi:hypothetical protein